MRTVPRAPGAIGPVFRVGPDTPQFRSRQQSWLPVSSYLSYTLVGLSTQADTATISPVTLLYYDPIFLEHDTGAHPECADRVQAIVRHLDKTGLDQQCTRVDCPAAQLSRLKRVHRHDYITSVERFTAKGGGKIESDTIASEKSYEVAVRAAGAVADAVQRVVQGDSKRALCLVRPPGHHALAHSAMGFCLFNNVAIGARVATTEFSIDRVLIVDWDVHHGNGTQAAFWEDEQVGFLSIHRWPFYPGTGSEHETGSGRGLGTTLNLPVAFGTSRSEYQQLFTDRLESFAAKCKPQLVLLSAGFDSHREDPIGSLGLETEDFAQLTRKVIEIAEDHAGGRLVSVLEGGYNTTALAHSVGVHLRELLADHGATP